MLRRKVAESLTARIFLITAIILLGAGAITFGLIAWATPSTYTAVVNRDLTEQVGLLAERLAETSPDSCGALLDEFILSSGASAILVGPDGSPVETGSSLMVQAVYGDDTVVFQTSEEESAVSYAAVETESEQSMTVTMSEQTAITAEVRFSGQEGLYTLYVTPRLEVENLAVRALVQMSPWLLLALLVISLIPILLLGRYDWPSADDYIYAYLPHEALLRGDGFWGEVWHTIWGYYKSWQGTFTALALMALTPLTFSEYLYWLTPVVMLASLCTGTFKLTDTLVRRGLGGTWRQTVFVAVPILLLSIHCAPFPKDTFY